MEHFYDNVRNIETITDHFNPSRSQDFHCDEFNRLKYANSLAYEATPITFDYDTIGNMYTNNYDNKPSSMGSISFVYDYKGQRVKKTIGSTSTIYIDKLYECTGGTTNCTKYIFAGRNRIAKKTGDTIHYYHPDHLGSSSVITSNSGGNAGEIAYSPFGEARLDTMGPNVRHKFTGQEWDSETNLYYYKARYYDPMIGRFVSAATIVQVSAIPSTLTRQIQWSKIPQIRRH